MNATQQTRKRKPTIYEALAAKLGRVPAHAELCAEVKRILTDATVERATQGKLTRQPLT